MHNLLNYRSQKFSSCVTQDKHIIPDVIKINEVVFTFARHDFWWENGLHNEVSRVIWRNYFTCYDMIIASVSQMLILFCAANIFLIYIQKLDLTCSYPPPTPFLWDHVRNWIKSVTELMCIKSLFCLYVCMYFDFKMFFIIRIWNLLKPSETNYAMYYVYK